jgi:methionine-rich copper-binding protein CopC
MDHSYIETNNIVARYEMGKLSPGECTDFEEHFVDCPQCQEQLATTADLRQALHKAARRGDLLQEREIPAGWIPRSVVRWAIAACLAVAVMAGAPLFFLIHHVNRIENELTQARTGASGWERKYESEHQTAAALEKQLQQIQGQTETSAGSGDGTLPILASVFALNQVRSADSSSSEPANWVVISRQPQWIVLSLDREESYKKYQVTLTASSGRVLWNKIFIAPTASNRLSVSLPSKLLPSGDYSLLVEGRSDKDTFSVSGRYAFRVKYYR